MVSTLPDGGVVVLMAVEMPPRPPRPTFEKVRPRARVRLPMLPERPRTRGDCGNIERPCLWIGCKYSLFLDVLPPTKIAPLGVIKMNFANPEDMPRASSCALDVADTGAKTLEEIAPLMNLSDERVRQVDLEARAKFRENGADLLRELARDFGSVAEPMGEGNAELLLELRKESAMYAKFQCSVCLQPYAVKRERADQLGAVAAAAEPQPHVCPGCVFERKDAMQMAKIKTNGAGGPGAKMHPTKGAVERDRYEEKLPCRLDDAVVAKKAEELAIIIREREVVLEQKREANSQYRAKLNHYDEQLKELAASVEQHTEMRNVWCIDYLLPNNELQTVRADTGEVIDKRTAKPEELQEPLSLDGKKKDAKDDEKEDDDDIIPAERLSGRQHGARDARPGDGG